MPGTSGIAAPVEDATGEELGRLPRRTNRGEEPGQKLLRCDVEVDFAGFVGDRDRDLGRALLPDFGGTVEGGGSGIVTTQQSDKAELGSGFSGVSRAARRERVPRDL